MATAGICVRLSKDKEDQTSTARQEHDCREYASRNGLEVAKLYADDGLSAFKRNVERPGYWDALEDLRSGEIETLLVWKVDRLSRRGMGQVGAILDDLEGTGRNLVFPADGVDSAESGNRILLAILAEIARQESENISTRVKSAKRGQRRAGKWLGGIGPYGFQVTKEGRLKVDTTEGPHLRRMISEAQGGKTLYAISRDLGADGVKTRRGGSWCTKTVSKALQTPALAGWLPESGDLHAGPQRDDQGEPVEVGEAVLSPAEFWTLRDALAARTTKDKDGKRRGSQKVSSLGTGLLTCALCGGAMSRTGGKPSPKYGCARARNGGDCDGVTIRLEPVDAYLEDVALSYLAGLDPRSDTLANISRRWAEARDPEGTEDRAAKEAELRQVVARLEELETAYYVDGTLPADRFSSMSARLRDQEAALREPLEVAEVVDVSTLLDRELSREAWEGADLEDRRAILAAVFRSVTVAKAKRAGAGQDYAARITVDFQNGEA